MNEWQVLGQLIENFMLLGAGILLAFALYRMGEYQVFSKKVKLSKLFPELTDLADDEEEAELKRKLAEAVASADSAE